MSVTMYTVFSSHNNKMTFGFATLIFYLADKVFKMGYS